LDITPYIRDLILSSECVILRGFGGFESSYRNASVDKNKKLIIPPGKKITFRPDWTKDNGVLENYIANALKIEPEKASKYISLFVYELFTKLENKGIVELEGIGRFIKNKSHVLEFSELEDETYLADSFGLDTLDIELVPHSGATDHDTQTYPIVPPPRKATRWYVLIGILIIMILVTSLIFFSGNEGISLFNFSKKSVKIPEKSDEIIFGKRTDALEDSVTKAIEQTLDKSTTPKKALSPDIQTEISKPDKTTGHFYFLVAGSFKSIKNAEILKKKLENMGFKSEILTGEGDLIKVVIGKYTDKNEAVAELQRIRGQLNQSVWLMEK
jgi:nucleoid DNA-binding protein